ncbi:MAG: hypothetical protein WC797_02065 [Candidatus Paceibacterota bacterium]|jgi:type II secretory pathway component PulJ
MTKETTKKGFTLVEMFIAGAVFSLVLVVLGNFQRGSLSSFSFLGHALSAQREAREVLKLLEYDLRRAIPSAAGGYPIESANQTSLIFFSDADNDGVIERVRYSVEGGVLKRGIVEPSGVPPSYNISTEVIDDLLAHIKPGRVFFYYPKGTMDVSGDGLADHVDVHSIKLLRFSLNEQPDVMDRGSFLVSGVIGIRSLRDN